MTSTATPRSLEVEARAIRGGHLQLESASSVVDGPTHAGTLAANGEET